MDNDNLQAIERIFIFAIKKIKLKCVDDNNQKIELNNMMIANILTPHNLISGPLEVFKFYKEGIAFAVIHYCSLYTIWNEINDPMGFAEHRIEEKTQEN
jgi:hypothetical protein